jgi:hypothetical protein
MIMVQRMPIQISEHYDGPTTQTAANGCGHRAKRWPLCGQHQKTCWGIPLIHMSSDLGLTTAHPGPVFLSRSGQSTPFARQVRASRPPLLRMRSSSRDSLLAPRFVWPRPLSVSTYPAGNDIQGETPGKTGRFLKCTEPRASRRVGQLVVTPPLTRGRPCPDPSVGDGPTAKSGAPGPSSSGPSSSHAGRGASTHPTATTENTDDR